MSKNITISEGNTARAFGNTKKLKTMMQGESAGSCFWVPEDETEAQPLYITENGMHEASEAGVYGFSEVHVNIPQKTTDDDGVDWDIHIDDEGNPHITIDDPDSPYTGPDISIDPETGDIDVHIPGNDPDDWPGWEDIDPDIKTDFDDWMDDPKFPGDWPGWDDMAPEIVDEFDDWIDDGNDPDLWPGWDDLNPDEKPDFDDWMDDPKDPDDWPGWEDIDPEIKSDFDEWVQDIDAQIDPEEAGLDPEKDVDVSFDPGEQDVSMIGTDGDGEGAVVDYDPETGDYTTESCPASIKIVSPPSMLEYTDGQEIDFSGLVVQGYLKSGELWSDSAHLDGQIPITELYFPDKHADKSAVDENIASSELIPEGFAFGSAGTVDRLNTRVPEAQLHSIITYSADALTLIAKNKYGVRGIAASASPGQYTGHVSNPDGSSYDRTGDINQTYTYGGKTVYHTGWTESWGYTPYETVQMAPDGTEAYDSHSQQAIAWTMIYGAVSSGYQNILVQYEACGKTLSTSFKIGVNTAPDYGGATGGGGQTSGGGAGRN